ncbi:MAG TPA: FAD-dependent oxidoreductase, partial [Burkholderiales bacterium]|nr:FAD-dependent oxidoreductase [Burkholderiales bacterium]
ANVFLDVLRDGLPGRGSDIFIPKVDLSTLFPSGAGKFIERNGGEILTARPVRSIRKKRGGFELTTDREAFSFSHVVCAVAPQHLARLLKELPEIPIPRFDYQPICTVYSQYPEDVGLPRKMIGSTRGLCQWFFDKGQIGGQKGLISGVISAMHPEIAVDGIASKIHEETKSLISDLPDPLWQKVIMEKRATFSCTVNLDRPKNATPLRNFHLAGDYTEGRYPATLESAVRSGLSCARRILDAI